MKKILAVLGAASIMISFLVAPVFASAKGPVYYGLPIYNSCELVGHEVIYGTFSTSAGIDFSKTRIILYQPVDNTGAYLYVYTDYNGVEYIPYYDGYSYDSYAYFSGHCGSIIH